MRTESENVCTVPDTSTGKNTGGQLFESKSGNEISQLRHVVYDCKP